MAKASAPNPDTFPRAWELLPSWREVELTDVIGEPFGPAFVPFNPSIHRAPDGTWRCCVRWANTNASKRPRFCSIRTRNVMLILDPSDWSVLSWHEMRDNDKTPRAKVTQCVGYEDMRLFYAGGELRGIACSLMLNIKRSGNTPEQVLLRFDEEYNIVESTPLRGAWSGRAQKNWMPFDQPAPALANRGLPPVGSAAEGRRGLIDGNGPRFLYSIDEQIVLDVQAAEWTVAGDFEQTEWIEEISLSERSGSRRMQALLHPTKRNWAGGELVQSSQGQLSQPEQSQHEHGASRRPNRTGIEMKIQHRPMAVLRSQEQSRVWTMGSKNLRGGGQLIKLDDRSLHELAGQPVLGPARWLGIGHEMEIIKSGSGKLYWHTLFTCDDSGKVLERSAPFKLADDGIEFVTGMAITQLGEGGRDAREVVFSYGVDDVKSRLGSARLDEVIGLLHNVSEIARPAMAPSAIAGQPKQPSAAREVVALGGSIDARRLDSLPRLRLRRETGQAVALLEEWVSPELVKQIWMTYDEARELHARFGEMLDGIDQEEGRSKA